jgi:hypothetical protein
MDGRRDAEERKERAPLRYLLMSVVAHEAVHLLGGTENSGYGLEKKCFGCPDTRAKKKKK